MMPFPSQTCITVEHLGSRFNNNDPRELKVGNKDRMSGKSLARPFFDFEILSQKPFCFLAYAQCSCYKDPYLFYLLVTSRAAKEVGFVAI